MMMLRWTPPHDRHLYQGLAPGDTVRGPLDAHPSHLWPWLVPVVESSDTGLPAPAPVAKPAPIEAPAPAVEAPQARPDLSGLHWRKVAALADALGYDGDDRSKAARLAWLDEQPAAAVARALGALEG